MQTLNQDNIGCLEQGRELLRGLSAEQYSAHCASCFNSSIGGHMRHSIDHYDSFLAGYRVGEIDYDKRKRDPRIETDPCHATAALQRIIDGLAAMPDGELDRPVRIKMDGGQSDEWTHSSVRRELQFLLSHTIHHFALIVAIAASQGVGNFPENFGMAPSTVKYRCAV